MNDLSTSDLRTLAEMSAPHCVSIYMPTHRLGPEIQQDPIRLKNLLGEAEKSLMAKGLRGGEARQLMSAADALVARHNFWQHQGDGLAIFLAPDFFRFYRLPFNVEQMATSGRRFYLKPLLPLLAPDGQFYVLALSQNRVRLLEGTRHTVREVDLEGVPQGLAEALRYDEMEPQMQFHTSNRAPGGKGGERPGTFHGQGVGDDDKNNILRYFHQIDDGLREWLGPRQAPLVLAGVEYLHPLYREANTYPHLVETGIKGNPDDLRPERLHDEAWQIVRPIITAQREAAASLFRRLEGARDVQGSSKLVEIVPAAHYGRVDSLFVLLGSKQWGSFDPSTGEVVLRNEPQNGDEDMIDLAAVQTYLNGGAVYAVPAEKMPASAPVAAVFRY